MAEPHRETRLGKTASWFQPPDRKPLGVSDKKRLATASERFISPLLFLFFLFEMFPMNWELHSSVAQHANIQRVKT